MTALALKETLQAFIAKKLPAFIWGPPGIGKSAIVKEIAEDLSIDFIDLRLTLLDPTDLKGIPFLQDNQAIWAAPNFLPHDSDTSGILFLDELNSAPPSVQAAAYQLILDRKIGEYILPANWAIIAAGNRESDRGVTHRMPSPLANRFVHFEMDINLDDWRNWAFKEKIDSTIISFLGMRPELLHTFDASKNEKSFATPRSWEFVDTIMKAKLNPTHLLESIGGAIGKETAAAFLAFKETIDDLPDYHGIFEGRMSYYPEDPSTLHVLASVLVSQALRNPQKIALNNMLRYTLNLEPEFAIMIIRDLQAQGVRFDRLEAWREWTATFSYMMG